MNNLLIENNDLHRVINTYAKTFKRSYPIYSIEDLLYIVYDCYYKSYPKWDKTKYSLKSYYNYLYGFVRSTLANEYKKYKVEKKFQTSYHYFDTEDYQIYNALNPSVSFIEDYSYLYKAIKSLNPLERQIIQKVFFQELSSLEVRKLLNLSFNKYQTLLNHAFRKLKLNIIKFNNYIGKS